MVSTLFACVVFSSCFTSSAAAARAGDKCSSSNKERLFKIRFLCVREQSALAPVGSASEDQYCEYTVDFETVCSLFPSFFRSFPTRSLFVSLKVHGCPTECHSADGASLCSKHGICAIDSTINAARCFCNKGWMGDRCDTPNPEDQATSSSSVTSALMTLVMILLFALLALAGVLYVKIKKVHLAIFEGGLF